VLGRIIAHLLDLGRVVLLGGQARGQHVGAQRVVRLSACNWSFMAALLELIASIELSSTWTA
jgi:hypothetical protein